MIYFVAFLSSILGFVSIQPEPSGSIYFILPQNLFPCIGVAFSSILQAIYESFSEYFSLLSNRLELNLLGFIWYLLLDIIGIILFIGLLVGIYTFVSGYIEHRTLGRILINIIVGLIVGLVFGCILGIVIKPYIKDIMWIGLGILLLFYLAITWFVRNA